MLDKTSSIICAFGLAAAAPRSPYRHLELCGIALDLTDLGRRAQRDLIQLILAVHDHAVPHAKADQHLRQRLHKIFVVDAQQLHFGAAGVRQRSENVEYRAEAKLLTDSAHIFHGGVVFLRKEEADADLVEQLDTARGALLNIDALLQEDGERAATEVLEHLRNSEDGYRFLLALPA